MAKYRHRLFEMYEFRAEAIEALTPKSSQPVTDRPAPELSALKQLSFSRIDKVVDVGFKNAQAFGEDMVNDLNADFEQIANHLAMDSRVLLNFTGVGFFCVGAIEEIALFKQKLRTKGSRLVLCCLDPEASKSFFGGRLP